MVKIPVRNLFRVKTKEMLLGFKTDSVVVFEDNIELALSHREIIMLRYVLEALRSLPELPIVSKYVLRNYYSNGIYVSKSINKCFESMITDMVKDQNINRDKRRIVVDMYRDMYTSVNLIYNEVLYELLDYATTLSILDFTEIQSDPDLLASIEKVKKEMTKESIDKSYEVLDYIIKNKPEYANNTIARAYISGTVNPNQVRQMLAVRGFVTEIDSRIFKYPIATSFTLGLYNIYDLAIESRSGAKALFLSNKAIQEAEYFAREMQLITMVVRSIVQGDCGSTETINWLVRDASMAGKSDIPNLVGSYYLNEETGKFEAITLNHTHLEGKVIKLRTALSCKYKDKDKVCTTCYGELSYGVHDHTGLGHSSSTNMTAKVSQSILSTKHLVGSASSGSIVLTDTAKKFFMVKNKDSYAFRANILGGKMKIKLLVDQKSGFGIKDIKPGDDVRKLNPLRVSRVSMFAIVTEDIKGNVEYYPITVKTADRYGAFTYEFLEYISNKGYTLDDNDRYVIDLDDWKSGVSFITLPQVEFNFLALSKAIKSEFKYMEQDSKGIPLETPESLLQKVFDLINSKLDVNIALLAVTIYAFTVADPENGDYSLGRFSKKARLARIEDIISHRSLGAGYAWEKVMDRILSPISFESKHPVSHPLDVMVKPNEVILNKYKTFKW